nr:MAG TPA: hypothetical protein [Caudoviricetes sp.]
MYRNLFLQSYRLFFRWQNLYTEFQCIIVNKYYIYIPFAISNLAK